MDLAHVLTTLRKAWWLPALTGFLGIGCAVAVNAVTPVTYRADVQQFVSITGEKSEISTNILSGSEFTLQRVKSYARIATSSRVLETVVRDLHLDLTSQELAERIQVNNPLDTVLIELAVTDTDPGRAAKIANAVSVRLGEVVEEIESPRGETKSPVSVTVTQPAEVPTSPVSPRIVLNIALGLALGVLAGSVLALLREHLDTTVTNIEDLESVTGGIPLGIVPFDPLAKTRPLVAARDTGVRVEAFRTLRTNLQFADVDAPPRVLVVTSPRQSEGKTSSACNIAITLALAGAKVVLIEADLRRPSACDYLGLDNAAGLTNVLAGQFTLTEVLVHWRRGTMAVLPSGPIPPNPSELLSSQHMADLVAQLREEYDHVIIDTPPVLPVTDAAVLATIADGALLLVRHSTTTRDDVARAVQALHAAKARLLGTVLNCVPLSRRRQAYGYEYPCGRGPATAPPEDTVESDAGASAGTDHSPTAPSADPSTASARPGTSARSEPPARSDPPKDVTDASRRKQPPGVRASAGK